ncbi:RbsD/FucU family protein [Pseudonocardia sp. HH130630-07]|uniref:RbsD/FucU family protein n=1 Tax=Pseudonocardia sp. HH130630-07 TaxID=1690815 RepID=UPI000814D78B|nr:RbsD/FucU domain-containing protein [Pseudonocardia sp. HH130630-07]ANY08345.1 transport protein RbsD/FucU [Pseudonocardia sp. HH130630-07]
MLSGIHPLLSGPLLAHLDAMGHSDGVVLADAHFPAENLGRRTLVLPGVGTPELLAAVRTVLPLDDEPALDLMAPDGGSTPPVHEELVVAAGATPRLLGRFEFYDAAAEAFLVVRTGETRVYANALLRKGVVT